jgi:hypothetical protein
MHIVRTEVSHTRMSIVQGRILGSFGIEKVQYAYVRKSIVTNIWAF